jgi:PAS domain S-box-containing protein
MMSVLYVDDEHCLLDVTKLFLEATRKFSVTTSESGSLALDLMKKKKFDAIISDYQMPGMDGIEFLRKVRVDHQEVPFILFTGKGREEVAIDAINNGADSYIQKGGDAKAQFAELAHRIRMVVERNRARTKLSETEKKYKALFDSLADGILLVDKDGQIIDVNASACQKVGYSRDEMVGMLLQKVFHDHGADLQKLKDTVPEREMGTFPALLRHKDDHIISVDLQVTLMEFQGQKYFLLGIGRNVGTCRPTEEDISDGSSQSAGAREGFV